MITLVTGGPGTGKTAWIVSQLLELKKISPLRSLYVHGIRDLKLVHVPIYCRGEQCEFCRSLELPDDSLFVEDWPEWKTPNDLLIIDEFQRAWPASTGSALIPSIAKLDTHRHYGLDFWLITQSPKIVHTNVKAMVGRHIHLVAKWSGRTQFEWPEVHDNIQTRGDAVTRPYKLPKHVYGLYKSAEVHTKQEKRVPLSLYFVVATLLVALGLGYSFYSRFNDRIHPIPVVNESVASGGGGRGNEAFPDASGTNSKSSINAFPDFKPVIDGVPESAPAYSELIKVSAAPIMMGCVQSKTTGDCKCYTAQATVYPTSKAYCEETIANHRFNPYLAQASKDNNKSVDEHNDKPSPL